METRNVTPPASSRIRLHTPPAPRWGAQEDSWTPFTPRRSSRVAAQRHSSPISPQSPTRQTPASPTKLSKRPSSITRVIKQRRGSPLSSDEDLQSSRMTKTSLFDTTNKSGANKDTGVSMLLTPARTPQSKRQMPKEVISSASRVLFHPRLANVDEAMPALKKPRKSKAFSLNPFNDESSATPNKKIAVYEDSKERIPTAFHEEDNPFMSKIANLEPATVTPLRRQTDREARMEESVRKDEGLIYVFRGKKVFRKYGEDESNDDDNLSDREITRRAGVSPPPRMTRTNVKPRVLFPNEQQRKAEEADEEALTDIEVPLPTTRKTMKNSITPQASVSGLPQPKPAVEESEPETKESELLVQESQTTSTVEVAKSVPPTEASTISNETQELSNKNLARPKKLRTSSPFDKWSRTKPSLAPPPKSKNNKRSASPMEQTSKRVRNEAS